mmetsp:Transcript_141273/g.256807  ORF Transcript_141273/g.256807 Transcript_141273/m.256807 type:complete len:81 (+) Transcript_141273:2654-2896(+)
MCVRATMVCGTCSMMKKLQKCCQKMLQTSKKEHMSSSIFVEIAGLKAGAPKINLFPFFLKEFAETNPARCVSINFLHGHA